MKNEKEFKQLLIQKKVDEKIINQTFDYLKEFENQLTKKKYSLEAFHIDLLDNFIENNLFNKSDIEQIILAFTRYFIFIKNNEAAKKLLAYLSASEVMPNLKERIYEVLDQKLADKVLEGISFPKSFSPIEKYPEVTAKIVQSLEKNLGSHKAKEVLTCNVHKIPTSAFSKEREYFLAATSLQDWLDGFHNRKVEEISKHAKDKTLWFEQEITDEVVEFVKNNPEILGAVIEDGYLYATKIPYNIIKYLSVKTDFEKRKYACHCPVAASSIKEEKSGVPLLWCYCSAGFEKLLFDTVFGVDVKVEVIESVLAGDLRCRFKIEIPKAIKERFNI